MSYAGRAANPDDAMVSPARASEWRYEQLVQLVLATVFEESPGARSPFTAEMSAEARDMAMHMDPFDMAAELLGLDPRDEQRMKQFRERYDELKNTAAWRQLAAPR
jgi:hypothetical protein